MSFWAVANCDGYFSLFCLVWWTKQIIIRLVIKKSRSWIHIENNRSCRYCTCAVLFWQSGTGSEYLLQHWSLFNVLCKSWHHKYDAIFIKCLMIIILILQCRNTKPRSIFFDTRVPLINQFPYCASIYSLLLHCKCMSGLFFFVLLYFILIGFLNVCSNEFLLITLNCLCVWKVLCLKRGCDRNWYAEQQSWNK